MPYFELFIMNRFRLNFMFFMNWCVLRLAIFTDQEFFSLQHSWSLRVILEGAWLCQAFMEKQEWFEGWGCRHCCSFWPWMFCMVLRWWDYWKGWDIHWILCLKMTSFLNTILEKNWLLWALSVTIWGVLHARFCFHVRVLKLRNQLLRSFASIITKLILWFPLQHSGMG